MQIIEQERHSWLKLSFILLFLFLYGLITVFAGDGETNMNFDNPNTVAFMYVAQVFGVLLIFVLPAILFSVFWTKSGIHYLGVTTKPAVTVLFIAAIGMLFALPMINWLADLNEHMKLPEAFSAMETWMKRGEEKAAELTTVFTKGTSIGKLVLNLFVIAFMAALSEELFFRGILQKVLIECFKNKHVGIWIAAALFSAFHMQFYGFFPRMFMGAYLGYLFLWSGSLWPGMIAHFMNNGMAVFLMWLSNRGVISADADKMGAVGNQWVLVITSAILVAASLYFIYRVGNKKKISEARL